jgi:heat shock transcription factor
MTTKQKLPPFILKTYQLVSDPSTDGIVSWDDDGKSFTVKNPSDFSNDILPLHFKHNNYCSFVRQLNIYGFHKVHPEKWMFRHENELFTKGDEATLAKITRKKQVKRKGKDIEDDSPKPLKEIKLNDSEQKVELFGIGFEVTKLKKSNDVLLTEINNLRAMYETQSNTVNWLVHELEKTKNELIDIRNSYPNNETITFPIEQRMNPIEQQRMNPIEQQRMNPIEQQRMNPIEQQRMNPIEQQRMNPIVEYVNPNQNQMKNMEYINSSQNTMKSMEYLSSNQNQMKNMDYMNPNQNAMKAIEYVNPNQNQMKNMEYINSNQSIMKQMDYNPYNSMKQTVDYTNSDNNQNQMKSFYQQQQPSKTFNNYSYQNDMMMNRGAFEPIDIPKNLKMNLNSYQIPDLSNLMDNNNQYLKFNNVQ